MSKVPRMFWKEVLTGRIAECRKLACGRFCVWANERVAESLSRYRRIGVKEKTECNDPAFNQCRAAGPTLPSDGILGPDRCRGWNEMFVVRCISRLFRPDY